MRVLTLTDDELRAVAAGQNEILDWAVDRAYYHHENTKTQVKELLSRIT